MKDTREDGTSCMSIDDRIEAICIQFEDAWKAGRQPTLEDHLRDMPADGRNALLRELLKLDLYYRQRLGEAPTPAEYHKRFPNDHSLLEKVLSPCNVGSDSTVVEPASSKSNRITAGAPRYIPVKFHAEGGLGEVHVANDVELRRRVALKRIQQRWAGNDESRRRFLIEAEITGKLEHPGIVPVYGLVHDEDGEPSYATRFIEGESLKEAIRQFHSGHRGARDRNLVLRQLLNRFVAVCNTIGYAHSRGIIHRDLKPANVMLGKFGETLVVDWGLAKECDGAATRNDGGNEETAAIATLSIAETHDVAANGTRTGDALGTPAFMSPEQARGDRDSIGPASDIFGLGAILYAILTSRAPFESESWVDALDQARRGEFPRPQQFERAVPSALAAVCQKAMAPAPKDRYPSALALAADVEHWLADEPVSAYREPIAGRSARWVRKHARLATGLAATVSVGLAALGVILWQSERARADIAAKEAEVASTLAFVEDKIFAASRPAGQDGGLGRDVKLIDAVEAAQPYVGSSFKNHPLVEARLRLTLAASFRYVGEFAAAETHALESVRLRTTILGPDHPDTQSSLQSLADTYGRQGRDAEAMSLYEQVLSVRKVRLGPHHPDTLNTRMAVATLRTMHDRLQGIKMIEEVTELQTATLGEDHPETLESTGRLAHQYTTIGRKHEALRMRERVLEIRQRVLGRSHPDTLDSSLQVANSYTAVGRHVEALGLFEETLPQLRSALGPEHPLTLIGMSYFANLYTAIGQHAEALQLRREALMKREARFGRSNVGTLWCMWGVAESLVNLQRGDEAAATIQEALSRASADKFANRRVIRVLMIQDLRRIVAQTGPAGRVWTEEWDMPNDNDPASLYNSACYQSLFAAAILKDPKTPAIDAPRLSRLTADSAMEWLRRAIAAGYSDVANIEKDPDLDALRERDDFKQLLSRLR
jgi:tetratricopeptide (TPR) repeat protein/tRNA A-37 threonylcarbamoyl transferase component Bud32